MQTKKTRTTTATADAQGAKPPALAAACLLATLLTLFLSSCTPVRTPRPYGYIRDNLPTPVYASTSLPGIPAAAQTNAACTLETPSPGHLIISYSWLNAALYISHTHICGPTDTLLAQAASAPAAHARKAFAIYNRRYENHAGRTYADLFDIEGDTAANAILIATDSTRHLICGALYFNCRPSYDSLRPSALYIREDMVRLAETLQWEN